MGRGHAAGKTFDRPTQRILARLLVQHGALFDPDDEKVVELLDVSEPKEAVAPVCNSSTGILRCSSGGDVAS
jgi:hypothetical protein